MPAKFSFFGVAAATIIPVALACGGDDGNTIIIPDAAMPDAPPIVCTAPGSGWMNLAVGSAAGTRGFATDYAMATCMYNPDGRYISWAARLDTGSPFDALFIDLWGGFGAFSGGTIGPGTYTISGDDTKYSTCGLCVMVLTDIVLNGNMITSYADWYFATAGEVQVTAMDQTGGSDGSGHYGIRINSATLSHVSKTANGNPSDMVADSCASSITNFQIDSKLLAGSSGDCATSGGNSAKPVSTSDGAEKPPIVLQNRFYQ